MWVNIIYNEYLSINSTICHFSCPDILLNLNNLLLNSTSAPQQCEDGVALLNGIVISNKKINNEYRNSITLTDIQKDILIGTMLGDARIEYSNKSSKNARLRFEQTFPGHASYLMFIYSHFYNLSGSGPPKEYIFVNLTLVQIKYTLAFNLKL